MPRSKLHDVQRGKLKRDYRTSLLFGLIGPIPVRIEPETSSSDVVASSSRFEPPRGPPGLIYSAGVLRQVVLHRCGVVRWGGIPVEEGVRRTAYDARRRNRRA